MAARILLASDDATEAVISQADTAGQAVRLWRIQRGMDADVDSLSKTDQAKVGDFLVRNGDDGANAIDISERNGEINLNDVNKENLDTELITYQDGDQTGELASKSLRQSDAEEPTLDSVEMVKIGDVFKGI